MRINALFARMVRHVARRIRSAIEILPCPYDPCCAPCRDCGRCIYHGQPCKNPENPGGAA